MDMSSTVIPKSDQLNSDDLIPGPRTITVTRVTANEGNGEQPVNVHFDGDAGKPFRPCKSMRRVMIAVWGADATAYGGRSMTIYRDPAVTWGGMEVGGIRISHMSHMEREMVLALTATKKARKPYRVAPLRVEETKPTEDKAATVAAGLAARAAECATLADLEALTADAKVVTQRAWLAKNRPELAADVDAAITDRADVLTPPDLPA